MSKKTVEKTLIKLLDKNLIEPKYIEDFEKELFGYKIYSKPSIMTVNENDQP